MRTKAALTLAMFSLYLFADEDMQNQKIDRVSEQNVYGDWQGKNQSASVMSGFTTELSFLYWKAVTEGLVYAQEIDGSVGPAAADPIIIDAKVKDLDYEWDPGFKVGLGYIFDGRQQWDTSLYWTYFHSTAAASASVGADDLSLVALRPTWLPFLMGSVADRAKADWTFNYNVIDACIARDFFLGKYLSLRPQAGIRGAWLYQDYEAKYRAGQFVNGGATLLRRNTRFKGSNDYSGAGLRFGSDAKWYLTKNLIIQGNGFISLLYGEFRIKEFYDGAFPLDVGAGPFLKPETIDLRKDFNAVRPNLETELGATWQIFFNNDKFRFALGAFYQLVYWFNQNNLVNQFLSLDGNGNAYVTNINPQGDLSMQGVRIQANLDF